MLTGKALSPAANLVTAGGALIGSLESQRPGRWCLPGALEKSEYG